MTVNSEAKAVLTPGAGPASAGPGGAASDSAMRGVSSPSQAPQRKPKCVVKGKDMPDEMANAAIEVAVNALDRFELERDMAMYVKQEFDKRYQPTWHCIVGRHFGSYVSHEMHGFIYFYIDKLAVLLFRSGESS